MSDRSRTPWKLHICSQRAYLLTTHCAVLPLWIIVHRLPAQAPQVGRYAFIGPGGSPPEAGSWEVAAGKRSGVYEGGSGGMFCLPLHGGVGVGGGGGGGYQTRTW